MNIIDVLEQAKNSFADREMYEFKDQTLTAEQVYEKALAVATKVSRMSDENKPIAVISNKNLFIPSIYLGIAYADCFYIPISTEMPEFKIKSILNLTEVEIVIYDEESEELVSSLGFAGKTILIDDCVKCDVDHNIIDKRRNNILDTNPLYVIFTSGSTGVPKGVVTCHASVVDYVTTFADTFKIDKNEIFGNQAPLDYIAGIRDMYIPLLKGCKSVFIPKTLFSTPKILFKLLNEKKITAICWVSDALSLCCRLHVFDEVVPNYLKKVFFTGSVFDCKDLNLWKEKVPSAIFVNHYGPTEITASCTYYVADNSIEYSSNLPIGVAFANRKVFVLNENGELAKPFEKGEICVLGRCLALGYFRNEEKTRERFVQNPLNKDFAEKIYLTGDVGFIDDAGILHFAGRKDNQIKHMGHRVELEEIEGVLHTMSGVSECCCAYNYKKSVITLFYCGSLTPADISRQLREKLPSFMIPRKFILMNDLPKLFNGKIDRQALNKRLAEES